MAALAAAVVVRGLGDIIDNKGSALSWFSPLAWAQQMRPFVDLRWWPFLLLLGTTLALMLTAHLLEGHRQYAAGVLPSRGENPNAPEIKTVVGLNGQLQRGLITGWGFGVFLGGMAFGSMAKSLRDSIDTNPLLARAFTAHGLDSIFATFNQVLAIAVTAYAVSAILRLAKDEQSGITEAVLARAVSRWTWLLSAVAMTALGSALLMTIAGLGVDWAPPAPCTTRIWCGVLFLPVLLRFRHCWSCAVSRLSRSPCGRAGLAGWWWHSRWACSMPGYCSCPPGW